MSNSSRIEAATRDHIGTTLTSEQITELVKMSNPDWKGGVYPTDAAYKRDGEGKLIPRGKVAYGDGVLEYLGENSFKVLSDKDIVRRPSSKKRVSPAPVAPTPAAVMAPAPVKSRSKPVVATKQKARVKAAVQR